MNRKVNLHDAHYVVAGLIHYAGRALEMGYLTREEYDAIIRSIVKSYPSLIN